MMLFCGAGQGQNSKGVTAAILGTETFGLDHAKIAPPLRLDQQRVRVLRDLGRAFRKRGHLAIPDRQHRFVIVVHPQGLHANLVDVGRDAAARLFSF